MTTRKKAQTTRRGDRPNFIYLSVGRARQGSSQEAEQEQEPEKAEEEVAQPQRRTRRPKGEAKEQKEVEEAGDAKEKVQKRRGRQPKSVMGPADIDKCMHLTVELISDNYSFGFRTTLSEEQSNEYKYKNAVQAPMDLATVLENLRRGAYTTRKEWQNDVNSIWQNALGYHKVNAMYYVAANVMKQKFAKMVEEMDMSEEELWLRKVVRQLQKLDEIDCA